MEPTPALAMRGMAKTYPGVRALDGVDFQVQAGHLHALLGENGAGKSTLMKILVGVIPAGAYGGEVWLDGRLVRFASPYAAQCQGIGYVPQEITVLEHLSVAENIFIGQWNGVGRRWLDVDRLRRQATELLASNGIDLDARQAAGNLNASQRQLLMVARALSRDPRVLVLDEATASLTLDETGRLFAVLRRLRSLGRTCIYITHKLSEVGELADQVTVLRDGARVAGFSAGGFDQDALVKAMVGRELTQLFPPRTAARPAPAEGGPSPAEGGTAAAQGGPAAAEEALRVEDLTIPHARLAGRNLVEGVSFAVGRGEVLGLGGLVGSGRSEVLRAIYGQLRCTGRISIAGRHVRIRTPQEAMAHGLGLVTEDRKRDGLLLNMGIRENATLHRLTGISRWSLIDRGRERRIAEDFRQRLAIRAANIEVQVRTLSGGNQQKVVLAKSLFPEPQVLLLDEPTKGIDVGAKAEIYALINALADQGLAIVLVSSDLPELLALADRHVVLFRGRIHDRFPRAEADEQRFMRAATGQHHSPRLQASSPSV